MNYSINNNPSNIQPSESQPSLQQSAPSPKNHSQRNILVWVLFGAFVTIIACGAIYYGNYAPQNYQPQTQVKDETADWQTYANNEGKFSFKYPAGWALGNPSPLGIFFEGNEGVIEVRYKGIYGFESCEGAGKFELHGEQLNSCHGFEADGSEYWQISRENLTIIAHVKNSSPSNREVVLKILSTFTFTK